MKLLGFEGVIGRRKSERVSLHRPHTFPFMEDNFEVVSRDLGAS